MKKILLIVLLVFCSVSCQKSPELEKIYIKTINYSKSVGEKEITELEDVYFKIELQRVADEEYYMASRTLQGKMNIYIVDSLGETIHFNSDTELMNFMFDRGYTLEDQKELRYGWDLTFKQKQI